MSNIPKSKLSQNHKSFAKNKAMIDENDAISSKLIIFEHQFVWQNFSKIGNRLRQDIRFCHNASPNDFKRILNNDSILNLSKVLFRCDLFKPAGLHLFKTGSVPELVQRLCV